MDHPYIPAPSGGLLGQLATLGNVAVQGIAESRDASFRQDRQKKEQQAGMLSKGLIEDTDPNSPTFGKMKRDPLAEAQYQQNLAETRADSPESQQFVNMTAPVIARTHPELKEMFQAGKISAMQAKEYLNQFAPEIKGEYQVKARQPGIDQAYERLKATNSKSAQGAVNNDKIINTYIPRLDGAQKILSLIDGAEKGDFKSNQALLGQLNAEIARLETGSQSPGLGQSEKTEMEDSAAKMHNILDTITGNVTGVNLHEKFQQARGMVNDLGRSYSKQINNRMGALKAGSLPSQQDVFDKKSDYFKTNYPSFSEEPPQQGLVSKGILPKQPASGEAPLSFEDFKKLKRAGKL